MELMISIGLIGMVTAGGVGLATRIAQSLANVEDMAIINSEIFMLGEEIEIFAKQAQYIGVMNDFYDDTIRSMGNGSQVGSDLFVQPDAMGDMLLFLFYDEVIGTQTTVPSFPKPNEILLTRMVAYYRGNNGFLKKYDSDKHGPIPTSEQGKPFFEVIPSKNDDDRHENVIEMDTQDPLFISLNGDAFVMQSRFKKPMKSQKGATKTFEFRFASRSEEH